jgi:hypothetical protein
VPGHGSQEGAFSQARCGEDADSLAAADGQERVDGAYSGGQGRGDERPVERVNGRWGEWLDGGVQEGALVVDGVTHAVEHAADEGVADASEACVLTSDDAVAGSDACGDAQGHDDDVFLIEADDLAVNRGVAVAAGVDIDDGADGDGQVGDTDGQATDFGDSAPEFHGGGVVDQGDLFGEQGHQFNPAAIDGPERVGTSKGAVMSCLRACQGVWPGFGWGVRSRVFSD